MTVFDALTKDHIRDNKLPTWLTGSTDVSETSQKILARLQASTDQVTPVGPITMKVKGLAPFEATFTVDLEAE